MTKVSVVLLESIFDEDNVRLVADIVDRCIHKIDTLLLPIPEELIQISFRGYIDYRTVDQVADKLVETYENRIIQIRPLTRILKPLIEVLYKALTVNPELEILTTYSMEKLRNGEITTIDIISLTMSIDRFLKKIDNIHDKVRNMIDNTILNIQNILRRIFSKTYRKCIIIPSSCSECLILRELMFEKYSNMSIDIVSTCSKVIPPSQLIYMAIYVKDSELIRKIHPYYRDFILNYLIISNTIHEAYVKYLRDNLHSYYSVMMDTVEKFRNVIKLKFSNQSRISISA